MANTQGPEAVDKKRINHFAPQRAPLAESHPAEHLAPPNFVQRVQANPRALGSADVLHLQRTIGNRATIQLLNRGSQPAVQAPVVQRALKVGPADDKYEQEADTIARQVQRASKTGEEELVQTATDSDSERRPIGPEGGEAGGDITRKIESIKSGGSSLPTGVSSVISNKLQVDASQIKAHTGPKAAEINRALGSKAATHGNHIIYGQGQSPSDIKLTTHEAVHTVQQGAVQQLQPARDPAQAPAKSPVRRRKDENQGGSIKRFYAAKRW
jgi:hypothetical protein